MANPQAQRFVQTGIQHHQGGRIAEAAQCYARARALAPKSWEAHQFGGMAALLLGRNEEALQLFGVALLLNPKAPASAIALGLTQLATGAAEAAEKTLRLAVKLDARSSEAWDNLGLILNRRGATDEALVCHAQAVKVGPKNVMAWLNQGVSLLSTPRVWEAQESFERVLALAPNNETAEGGRAVCLYRSHRVEEAAALFNALYGRNPQLHQTGSYLLMALNNLSTLSNAQLWQAHQQFGKAAGGPLRTFSKRELVAGQRLRVAFLSCDLKAHSVSYFLLPLLRAAKEAGVDLLLYHDHGTEDEVSKELKGLASVWRNVAGQLDGVLEKQILADAPDVLVDLAGHTGGNRLGLLAHRLAWVQISYLGYPNTTGVEAIDYRFVDPVSDPQGQADVFHSECLVRFSNLAWCYQPPVNAPEPLSAPRGQGAVFCSFNHATKLSERTLSLWSRILERVPQSRLLIKSPGLDHPAVRVPFLHKLGQCGLPLDRVEILGTCSSVAEHLALYKQAHIALDTTPYNGTTTTCEALWMGLPVVTLAGDRHAARVSTSILQACGLAHWISDSEEHYVQKACSLAADLSEGLPVLRGQELRERVKASVLLDSTTQSSRFWDAVWKCYQEGPRL